MILSDAVGLMRLMVTAAGSVMLICMDHLGEVYEPDCDPYFHVACAHGSATSVPARFPTSGPEYVAPKAGTGVGQDSVLEVRVELVDSEPKIWRRFELRGFL